MLRAFLFLVIIALTGTGGDVTLTRAMKKVGEVHNFTPRALLGVAWRAVRVPQLWLGILFLTAAFFSFLALLSWQPVSFVLPASALGYVAGAFAAKFILRERIDPARWIGVILVCIGVVFVWAGDDSLRVTSAAILHYTRLALLVLAAVPLAYFAFAIATAEQFFNRAHAESKERGDFMPPMSILKPIRGLDREPYENFASFCRQDYPRYEILFAAEPGDPAIPVIQRLIEDFPGCDIRLIESSLKLGENNKVCKLAELVRVAKYDYFVESDSDVRVGPEYLRQVAAKFHDPRVGGVTALYRGYQTRGLVSALDCLGQSVALCGSVLVARKLEGLHFMMGSTMAVTRERLAEIGGFESLADRHSDDYELGNRIAQKGYRVELLPEAVWMSYPPLSFAEYVRHEFRWYVGVKHIRPASHFSMIFMHGIAWAIGAALLSHSSAAALSWLAAYFLLRYAMGWMVGVWGMKDPVVRRKLVLLPLRDFLAFFIWLASFASDRIRWRGAVFTLDNGRLVPVSSATRS